MREEELMDETAEVKVKAAVLSRFWVQPVTSCFNVKDFSLRVMFYFTIPVFVFSICQFINQINFQTSLQS